MFEEVRAGRISEDPLDQRAKGALLGAAVGDALGWPQEDRSQRIDQNRSCPSAKASRSFVSWRRRSGGRFYAHEEVIKAGEYSDDTQLILATARSLLFKDSGLSALHHRNYLFGRCMSVVVVEQLSGLPSYGSTAKHHGQTK